MGLEMAETDMVRQNRHGPVELDATDRKILGALAEDATRSYAQLGVLVNLSAPAVHERVKRLRRDGVIRATVAQLDGCKMGQSLLTFVLVETGGFAVTRELLTLKERPEVEEIHTVAGDGCVMIKVRAKDTESLEQFLMDLQRFNGVRGLRSYIVLSSFLERGPQPV